MREISFSEVAARAAKMLEDGMRIPRPSMAEYECQLVFSIRADNEIPFLDLARSSYGKNILHVDIVDEWRCGVCIPRFRVSGEPLQVTEAVRALHSLGVLERLEPLYYVGRAFCRNGLSPHKRAEKVLQATLEGRLAEEELRGDLERHKYALAKTSLLMQAAWEAPGWPGRTFGLYQTAKKAVEARPIDGRALEQIMFSLENALKHEGVAAFVD